VLPYALIGQNRKGTLIYETKLRRPVVRPGLLGSRRRGKTAPFYCSSAPHFPQPNPAAVMSEHRPDAVRSSGPVSGSSQCRLCARQLRNPAVDRYTVDHIGESGAGRFAAKLEIIQRGTQFEQAGALTAGEFKRGGDIGRSRVRVGVGVGANPQQFGIVEVHFGVVSQLQPGVQGGARLLGLANGE
jgi:hypothetical protein